MEKEAFPNEVVWFRALDVPEVLTLVFHPRPDFRPVPASSHIKDLFLQVGPGVKIHCRLYLSGPTNPLIIFFHGNGEIVSDYDDIAPFYLRQDINLLVVDYRGYGRSTGSPTLSSMLVDALKVMDKVRGIMELEGLSGALYVMGRSLGSAPALEIAYRNPSALRGLIIESGFSDTLGLLQRIGIPLSRFGVVTKGIDPQLKRIRAITLPTLIIHGEWDQIIPAENARELYASSGARMKRLVIIPQAGHNDLIFMGLKLYFQSIAEFIRKLAG